MAVINELPEATPANEDVYCTLLLDDNYLRGALVVAKSLRDGGTKHKLAVLVTLDHVSLKTRRALEHAFDYVIGVTTITNDQLAALSAMGRPDLASTFTKITLWQQTQFRKIVYLDADTLVLKAPDELFDLPESFAAAPDIGFPDCFNSGMMMLNPSLETYNELFDLAIKGVSLDGGDQGLLNIYFSEFRRLSILYNLQFHRVYRLYMAGLIPRKANIKVVHFLGKDKPWHLKNVAPLDDSSYAKFFTDLVGRWWEVHGRLGVGQRYE